MEENLLENRVTSDCLVHVVTGRKTWETHEEIWTANPGETLYFKKGAAIINQHFEVDFCLLIFFIPSVLVKATVRELAGSLGTAPVSVSGLLKSAARVKNDMALAAYLRKVGECDAPSVVEMMEENFRFNLSVEEYAPGDLGGH